MKKVLCGILLSLTMVSQAQAGFWDWLPGRKPRTCNYSEKELRSVVPVEQQRAWNYTPKSYTVEKFDIATAFEARPWLRDFRYIIVVNKAAAGPTAQTIQVYEDGYQVVNEYVSTGREKLELKRKYDSCVKQPPNSYYSVTATGYYNVQQLVRDHRSGSFDADMPYAIFYDRQHGLALHQVADAYIKRLGTRASGGCTRMSENLASNLFDKVQRTRGAEIPVFNKDGSPVLDANGQVQKSTTVPLFDGRTTAYSAIVIIQDIAN